MLLPIILIFVIAFGALLMGSYVRSKYFNLISLLPFSLFLYFLSFIPSLQSGSKALLFRNEWIPSLGVSLDFRLDGLSLLFSLMITGIGTLIYWYAAAYLKEHIYLHRFYSYLTLFMGAMLGVVLSDNMISLFVFWELTSISSFFLIGFNTDDPDARKSALWALGITGFGGFFLLAAFTIMGSLIGSYSIAEVLQHNELLTSNAAYFAILVLLFIGAFTKSAQFPFHFWLPGAMKAPTPVSAYLHSATMVKAGIYLLARFTPVLSDGLYWNYTLMIVGGITMVLGAFFSIFKTDMKGVLAYSTISALGILTFLLGVGTDTALYAAATFILVHALYKAALFMITGIIDHQTHTRDLTLLSGLRKVFPVLFFAAALAALSSAGVPLTFGFLSKELIYGAVMETTVFTTTTVVVLTSLAFITNVLLTCSGFLVGIKPFIGKLPSTLENTTRPPFLMWMPPVVLSIATLVFGLWPQWADKALVHAVAWSIKGQVINQSLVLWHGFNPVLLLSVVTIVLGSALYFIVKVSHHQEEKVGQWQRFSSKNGIEKLAESFRVFAFKYTAFFHNGYLRIYLLYIVLFMIGIVGYKLFVDVPFVINTEHLSAFRVYEFVVFVIAIAAVVFILITSSRLAAIAGLGIVGYAICLIFVFYGAPDLAMTQFAIDTLTVVLFVLVLFKLPTFLNFSNLKIQIRDAVVALAFGTLIALITLQALVYPSDKEVSKFYADNTYVLAKGKNVVNVILVDFRGFDTLIETIVLSIAAIGVYSILKYKTKDGERSE